MKRVFLFLVFIVSALMLSTHTYSMNKSSQNLNIIVIDCFGVLFDDRFKDFITSHETALQKYINSDKASQDAKDQGFPKYYYSLAKQIDMNEITEGEFYRIFSEASLVPAQDIKNIFNDTDCLREDVLKLIIDLKSEGYKIVLIANADRNFLRQFINKDISFVNSKFNNLRDVFDLILTSSEIRSHKCSSAMLQAIYKHFDIVAKQANIIAVDDAENNVKTFQDEWGIQAILYQNPTALRQELNRLKHSK